MLPRTALIATILWWGSAAAAPLHVWTATALEKIRPDTAPGPEARTVQLSAARGECEAAQLVVHGGANGVRELRAAAFSFRGPGGAPLGQRLALYRVGFVPVDTPSNSEGAPGLWPDPLIPALDDSVFERRDAFPVDVPAGHAQPVWAEICVPHGATPGWYAARIRLWARGSRPVEVKLSLLVRRFALPATSSLVTTFGFSGRSASRGHIGAVDEAMVERLTVRYARAALDHRLSLHGMSMRPPEVARDPFRVSFAAWDREVAPFMDGTASATGARFTALELPTPPVPSGAEGRGLTSNEDLADYYRAAAAHLAARGWLSRAFVYLADEPEDLREVRRRAEILHRAAPGLRALVTTPLAAELLGAVDVWAPQLNCFLPGAFCPRHVRRAAYDPLLAAGGQLFWYQACGAHGCGTGATPEGYFARWPRYVIDAPMAAHRIMGWLARRYRVQGELYYNTVEHYGRGDVWRGSFEHGGNGDGTLFYPGTPGMIGGTEQVPVESMRLKAIRDGLEDYEYLALLAALDGAQAAERAAAAIAPDLRSWESRPARILAARESIAARIEQQMDGELSQ